LADWVKWCAIDKNGNVWGSGGKPWIDNEHWIFDGPRLFDISVFKFNRGTVDWRDSLRKRPESK
jgi:hypothetical protein